MKKTWRSLLSILLAALLLCLPTEPAVCAEADPVVSGAWSGTGHDALADSVSGLQNIDVIKAISAACDSREYLRQHPANAGVSSAGSFPYQGSHAYHAVGNYVAASRYLYALARYYAYGTPMSFAAYDAVLTGLGTPYASTNRQDIDSDLRYMAQFIAPMMPGSTNDQRMATAAFGMLFHLLGDIYAHRTVVPTSAVSVTNRTGYGSGSGGNEGKYFVKSDFRAACSEHGSGYRARRSELLNEAIQALQSGFLPFLFALGHFVLFAVFGRLLYSSESVDVTGTAETDAALLQIALDIPKTRSQLCGGAPCFGAMKRIAELGVLQFKDVKYFLADGSYTAARAYYEDQAPDNAFYLRRWDVAKSVVQQFVSDYAANRPFNPENFLPIYSEKMCGYYLKLDQLYNYLRDTNQTLDWQTNAFLKAGYWQSRNDSLFNYTTIVQNGTYFIDPATYPPTDQPAYSTVFPANSAQSAEQFYL